MLFEELIHEVDKSTKVFDVAVIGCGPAGCSAAIYLSRAGFNAALFGSPFKTSLSMAGLIENYPGFKKIEGLTLVQQMLEQAKECGASHIETDVSGIMRNDDGSFTLITADNDRYTVSAIIFATGALRKKANIKGELEYMGKGVSYCAVCDGPLYKNKPVAIIGHDRNTGKEAVFLSNICSKVYIISEQEFDFDQEHMKILRESGRAEFLHGTIREIFGSGSAVTGIKLDNREINVAAVFIVLGDIPNTYLAQNLGVKIATNGIVVNRPSQETNVPGVFAAGDVTDNLKQVAIAVGEGCAAALHAMQYIRKKRRTK
ncbi:MAG: FAD-dependent oxidoreductase [Candidatus Korarchaeota archaeon]